MIDPEREPDDVSPEAELAYCYDCDRVELKCVCEDRERCSCGVPILACPCAYGSE